MNEHRHNDRAPLVLYLDVRDEESGDLLGHLGDISHDGLMFLTRETIALQQQRNLCIEVPELDGQPEQILRVRVETRWYKPNINPEWECIGCQIIAIAPEQVPLLEKIAAKLCFGKDVEVHRTAHA
jgi:hypothetical protein